MVVPFTLQLLGEYVIEIIQFISQNTNQLKGQNYSRFIKSNPEFCARTSQRILSYWYCYFRHTSLFLNEHCGFLAAKELGLWDYHLAKKLPKHSSSKDAD